MRTSQVGIVLLISTLFNVFLGLQVVAQTCCTGSAPITGSIRISTIDSKQWNLNIIADHNNMADLYLEDSEVEEDLITRATNSILLQTNYGISDKLSVSAILPLVNKWEAARGNKVSTTAIGDFSLLLQYALLNKNKFLIIIGSGIKLPTGATQLKNEQTGIIIQPSLQPGSGSIDYLFLTQFQYAFAFRHSLSITQSFSYQITGTSSRFASHQSYKFGNEFQSFTSIADQFVIFNKVTTPSLTLRISQRATIVIETIEDVNSGGVWAYVSPGLIIQLNNTIGFLTQADLPVFRTVNGFQLIPSYPIRGGILISF